MLVSFSKLSKQLVLKLQLDTVHVIPNNSDDSLVCFSALNVVRSPQTFAATFSRNCFTVQKDLFHEHKLESKNNNVIALDINTSLIASAWKDAAIGVSMVQLKLTKRSGVPCLAATMGAANGSFTLSRDLPVRVLTMTEANAYGEPMVQPPSVSTSAAAAYGCPRTPSRPCRWPSSPPPWTS